MFPLAIVVESGLTRVNKVVPLPTISTLISNVSFEKEVTKRSSFRILFRSLTRSKLEISKFGLRVKRDLNNGSSGEFGFRAAF